MVLRFVALFVVIGFAVAFEAAVLPKLDEKLVYNVWLLFEFFKKNKHFIRISNLIIFVFLFQFFK